MEMCRTSPYQVIHVWLFSRYELFTSLLFDTFKWDDEMFLGALREAGGVVFSRLDLSRRLWHLILLLSPKNQKSKENAKRVEQ